MFRPSLTRIITLSLLSFGLALTSVDPASADHDKTYITFEGGGFGHGVGMSQFGALGRAEAGHSAEDILAAKARAFLPALFRPAWVGRNNLFAARSRGCGPRACVSRVKQQKPWKARHQQAQTFSASLTSSAALLPSSDDSPSESEDIVPPSSSGSGTFHCWACWMAPWRVDSHRSLNSCHWSAVGTGHGMRSCWRAELPGGGTGSSGSVSS